MFVISLVVAGCGVPPAAPVGPTGPIPDPPSPWSFSTDDEEPPVDLDAVGRALDAAIVEALIYDARDVVEPYVDRYELSGTPSCPAATADAYGNLYWANGCNADDGSYFGGYLSHTRFSDFNDGYYLINGDALSGVITVIDPFGWSLDVEGDAQWLEAVSVDGTVEVVVSFLNGGFAHDLAGSSWLGAGPPERQPRPAGVHHPRHRGRGGDRRWVPRSAVRGRGLLRRLRRQHPGQRRGRIAV